VKTFIPGYEADVYRALWERPMTFGAPRIWAAGWLILALYIALLFVVAGRFQGLTGIGLAWLVGQGVLVKLTQWDRQWDQLLTEWLFRKHRTQYYRAG